jgi:hypothetical protein
VPAIPPTPPTSPTSLSLPGDYGWDPLGLADPKVQGDSDTMNLAWLSYAEVRQGGLRTSCTPQPMGAKWMHCMVVFVAAAVCQPGATVTVVSQSSVMSETRGCWPERTA